MGTIVHNAIVVTTQNMEAGGPEREYFNRAVERAKELGCMVAVAPTEVVNGYLTMVVCPDGSKCGWPEDAQGNVRRQLFKDWLRGRAFEDGSSMYEWVEVEYGERSGDPAALVDSRWSKA